MEQHRGIRLTMPGALRHYSKLLDQGHPKLGGSETITTGLSSGQSDNREFQIH